MRPRLVPALLLMAIASSAAGADCVAQLDLQSDKRIVISTCPDTPAIAQGETFTIDAGGATIPVTADRVIVDPTGTISPIIHTSAVEEPANAIASSDEVIIEANGETGTAKVVSRLNPRNVTKYSWAIGPATKGDEDGDDEDETEAGFVSILQDEPADGGDDDEAGAIRFRYSGEYARGGFFGQGNNPLLQTTATLNIDSTDQDSPDFIDNNRLAVAVGASRLSLGRLWMHGTAGVEARVEKGFHHANRNADVVAKVTGWVPVLRSLTLFPRDGVFIAPPLSFTASYGYRDKKVENVDTTGRVFEATALYHLFLFDQYQIDLSARWTHNDVGNLPAGTPKTQRMYKATIAYLADMDKGFKVLTSFENGSFGVMLQDVRQYFIGVALSKFNRSGSSANP